MWLATSFADLEMARRCVGQIDCAILCDVILEQVMVTCRDVLFVLFFDTTSLVCYLNLRLERDLNTEKSMAFEQKM